MSSKTVKCKSSTFLNGDSETKFPHTDPHVNASINTPTMSASTSVTASQATSTATSPSISSSSLPTTLDTLLTHHLSRTTTMEITNQLRTFLLARAAHRLAAFWRRHAPSSLYLQKIPETRLLAAAQEYVARHAIDEQGNLKEAFETSYKTGPMEKKGRKEGREKYEIFESIEVTYRGGLEEESGNWEIGTLTREGEAVTGMLIGRDVEGFWAWVVGVKAECEKTLKQEAKQQGTMWEGTDDLGKLKRTKVVERALKLFGVRVEVEVRKKLMEVGIFKKVEGREDMVGEEAAVTKMREMAKKAKNGSSEKKSTSKGGTDPRKDQPRGRKRRSSDDMGFSGVRGFFQR